MDEAAVLGKVNGHILPLFCCLAMLCYLDRVNLAFAARQLNEDLGFSKAVYGLGSGAVLDGNSWLTGTLTLPSHLTHPTLSGDWVSGWSVPDAAFLRSCRAI